MPSNQLVPVSPALVGPAPTARRLKRTTTFGAMVMLLTFGGVAAWAGLVPLASAVVTQGQLIVASKRKQVQHREGGVVEELLVHDGSVVEAGAVIIRLKSDEARTTAELSRAKVGATERQLALANEELAIVTTLQRQGYASKRRYLSARGRSAELEGQLAQDLLRLRQAEHAIRNAEIAAPVTGTVVGMRVHTVGGVIQPGVTILEIVPSADPLVVEARLNPTDVDDIRLGLVAEVRFSSFKQRTTPALEGRVTHVSADVLADALTGEPYYRSLILIDKSEIARIGKLKLQPGMPAEVIIATAPRSVLTYLLQPLLDSTNRALREK